MKKLSIKYYIYIQRKNKKDKVYIILHPEEYKNIGNL